jgi:RNA polymerase subunit RPABC4/transcription elongation factor Spt4
MAPPEVTAKNCKICGHVLALSVKQCHICGAADPIKKEDPPFWP